MNKKAILFDGGSRESDSGKTTSSILLLKKLIKEGYFPEEFNVHTPNNFQKYKSKTGLINNTTGKILEQCISHDYYKQFTNYELANDFIGEKNNELFTYNDLIEGHIDFFCLLRKKGKWVLIFSPIDYKKFIDLLALVIKGTHKTQPIMDTFVLVTTIKDKKRGNIRANTSSVVNTVDSSPYFIYTTDSTVGHIGVESSFYLQKNEENAQKAFELIQSY